MKVKELIERLERYDGDLEVVLPPAHRGAGDYQIAGSTWELNDKVQILPYRSASQIYNDVMSEY